MGFTRQFAALVGSAVLAASAFAQGYPNKPVTMVVGFAAGGPTDIAARLIAEGMSPSLGQTIIVQNKPGANGQIAFDDLKRVAPDGYTIGPLLSTTLVAVLVAGKTFSPADVTPVAFIYDSAFVVLVNPNAPLMSNVHSLKDLIAVVKANPGKVNYTSAGTGSTGHLFGARVGAAQGLQWEHIGYQGLGPAGNDVMAGRVAVAIGNIPNDVEFIKVGRLRAVSTSGVKMARYPEAPGLAEQGYGQLAMSTWGSISGPAGLPKPVVDKLSAAVRAFFDKPDLVEKVALQFPEPKYQPPEVVEKRMRDDIDALSKVVKESGIRLN
ncbi:MAG TPA: tripartite tricarboxylate transporter substrate binding protein [Burkholderiales bacterium]|nr:tripartite tricarboxylate transporter substrate binding protein [Burkholderiales bacterium]